MSIGGYLIRNQTKIHFITFAVVEWIDVFSRKEYRDIFVESLKYCQAEKGLIINSWCLMSNHVHLVASSPEGNLSSTLRDLKKFTSRKIIQAIETNPGESRKSWMLPIFRQLGQQNPQNTENQFWRQENHPIELYTSNFTLQRIHYTHNNPVRAGIVQRPEDYLYSSARDYKFGKKTGLLDVAIIS